MAFRSEYVPSFDEESSDFFRNARKVLRTGASNLDIWTVDRSREMALCWMGSGREEGQGKVYWGFLDASGYYRFDTKVLDRVETSPTTVAVVISYSYRIGKNIGRPNRQTIQNLKEALAEHCRWSPFKSEGFERAELKLLDAVTCEEV